MKIQTLIRMTAAASLICAAYLAAGAQTPQLIKRTITKTDKFEFGAGGTVVVVGAPNGSIRVSGGPTNEIVVTAVITVQAANEQDLTRLAQVTGYITDETLSRTGIISVGTHDKASMKKLDRKFPKHLIGLPFSIDYVVTVPKFSDLEIDGGKGDLEITGVEGAISVNLLESDAKIGVIGGSLSATIGTGKLDVSMGVRGWRARTATIQMATGDLTVRLPANTSAEIDAVILRTGSVENLLPDLKPRDRKIFFTEKAIQAKAGVGGPSLKFTVGDGNIKMERLVL
ncbi:MAG TPA: hypothetical protein VNA17_10725 [Pyrinomonadaceae bacterium]|nr:hypothetical protein [Pyrinomonadaceae bacterium]